MLKRNNDILNCTLIALAAALAGGCGRTTDRLALRGAVLLDEKPVETGNIQLIPINADGKTISGALIQGGRYSIPRETGLAPGRYRVCIYASEKIDPKSIPTPRQRRLSPHLKAPVAKELIPSKYNANSELAIDVRADGSNTFDFTLTTN